MKLKTIVIAAASASLSTGATWAQEHREMGAHEHGHGALNIAVEDDLIAMELEVPGFDLVGFEHAAETDADRAAVEAGLAQLAVPLELFGLPAAAGCTVVEASAELHGGGSEEDHDDHDMDEAQDDHDHEDGTEEVHEEGEDDHDHDAEHDEHDDPAADVPAATHSEFHASYVLNCAAIDAATQIDFAYFGLFPNAEELEIQAVGPGGASVFEATRAAPVVALAEIL